MRWTCGLLTPPDIALATLCRVDGRGSSGGAVQFGREFEVGHLSGLFQFVCRVPNSDIGGSGVATCVLAEQYHTCIGEPFSSWLLSCLSLLAAAFCRSFHFCLFCCLLGLSRSRFRPYRSGEREGTGSCASRALVQPLGACASAGSAVLPWRRPIRRRRLSRPLGFSSLFWIWLLFVLRLPCCVWAAPTGLEALLEAAEPISEPSSSSLLAPDSLSAPRPPIFAGRALLGVQILAPHYHTAYAEVPLGPTEGPAEVLRFAEAVAKEHFHADLSVVVPCRPQPIVGYASLVAQPA